MKKAQGKYSFLFFYLFYMVQEKTKLRGEYKIKFPFE